MSFFSRLIRAFTGQRPAGSDRYMPIYVYSHRCREPIAGQVDIMNEISLADEGEGYYVRKVFHTAGHKRCFDQVEVEIWLDRDKHISRYAVQGGRWLTAEEYEVEVQRQAEEEARAAAEAAPTSTDESSVGKGDEPPAAA